jgi:prefoldin subunit 5
MDHNGKSSEVIFFLGAGASVPAGVPDTYSFVQEFIDDIDEAEKKETIEKIVQTLEVWNLEVWKKSKIDIELLLETLVKLKDRKYEPLLQFYEGKAFILKGYADKKPLIDDLKNFIKSRAIVSEEEIKYLQPLRGFIEEFRPLDIISLNYDTCIEQFCNVHKLSYQDGFDVHWNPKTFTTEHTDIRLYKLHGSVMWYQSDRGGYIKSPVMTDTSNIQLITGEKAENLMLYPMQKWDFAEPLLELLVEIKHLLESETCKFLIVVGYSFRDDHIRKILWDAARKNKKLHIIFIDPKAYQIYGEKLKYYDKQHKIPSSFDGKVICLPYKFEDVFPYLKNYYLTQLRAGLSSEAGQYQAEIHGGKASWISCIRPFLSAEYIEKAEEILKKIETSELKGDWMLSLELPLKIGINLSSNRLEERASRYTKYFNSQLFKIAVERINVSIVRNPPDFDIEINFNYRGNKSGSSYIGGEQFKEFIETLSEFCETRERFVNNIGKEFQKISNQLKKLKQYLKPFNKGKIEFESYIELRENEIPNIEQFRNEYNLLKKDSQLRNLETTILDVEQSILKGFIGMKQIRPTHSRSKRQIHKNV